jgi:aminomethyltransferase
MTDLDRDQPPMNTDDASLRETPLRGRHAALGARLIPFAGWLMPVQYSGILHEHRRVREGAGLFDLGHMGQVRITGPDALPFLQAVTTNNVATLGPGDAQYSLLPNDRGGVIDDVIVYRHPAESSYTVVVNASNRDKDVAWLAAQRDARPGLKVSVDDTSDETGMIAIQGPKAETILQRLTAFDLAGLGSFAWREATVAGVPVMVARTGYTGEDGFELYVPVDENGRLWDALLAEGEVEGLEPIGLGARDTLRLEARMPLYGNELSEEIGPLEAGLGWAVRLDKGDFVGREAIAAMKETGPPRRTVGFKLVERGGSPRPGFTVKVGDRVVGHVTSGAWSPTLGESIGLALVDRDVAGIGQAFDVMIRDKPVRAVQIKTPFYRRTDKPVRTT